MELSIQLLQAVHDTRAFSSGVDALDSWLKQVAGQHARKGISRTYVAVDPSAPKTILGYYSLTVAQTEAEALPADIGKKLPHTVPAVLIGRLAVAQTMQGKALGSKLLLDALQRIVHTSGQVGIAVVLVDAKDDRAAEFYEHFGFKRLPEDRKRLILPVSMAKAALRI